MTCDTDTIRLLGLPRELAEEALEMVSARLHLRRMGVQQEIAERQLRLARERMSRAEERLTTALEQALGSTD